MIVLTTPTGDIGGQLLPLLLDSPYDEDVRVVVRDPARLSDAVRDRVEVVTGSHGDADVVDRAFDGADAVFWCIPPNPHAASLDAAFSGFAEPAVDAFTAHGVRHVVGVSALGRGTAFADRAGLVTASLTMDDLIGASGVAYRALANPGFMDNTLRQVPSIRDRGLFTGPMPADRALPLAATRDIAARAADLLLDRSWTGVDSVAVLGPEDLSAEDMVAIMSDVLARPVRYEQQSYDDVAAGMTAFGASEPFVRGMIDMMRAKDDGNDDGVPRTPETASPTTFRQWCEDVLVPAVRA